MTDTQTKALMAAVLAAPYAALSDMEGEPADPTLTAAAVGELVDELWSRTVQGREWYLAHRTALKP